MISLDGKRIFVTAAAAGMGRSVAELSAQAGADVLGTDVDEAGLAELAELGIRTQVLDVTDVAAIDALFAAEPAFDGIVNMAGWVHHGMVTETDDAAWRKAFEINVDSIFHVIRAALPKMIDNGGGSIVNMASLASSVKGFRYRAGYASSKAFYATLGWTPAEVNDGAVFYQLHGMVLGLFGIGPLAADQGRPDAELGKGATTLGQNYSTQAEVDTAYAAALNAGATALKAPEKVFWGGYSGYYADPDGHVWEVAMNPFWPLNEDGSLTLPKPE